MDVADMAARVAKLLEDFKQQDTIAAGFPLLEDARLSTFVSAWRTSGPEWRIPEGEDFEDFSPSERWEWLWDFCVWDNFKMARMCGVSLIEIELVFERAKGFRLIYPDGTISDSAHQVMVSMVRESGVKAGLSKRNNASPFDNSDAEDADWSV